MKIEFYYSRVYFQNLNKYKSAEKSWVEVKELGQRFENKYQSEIKQIIEIIPELVGKPWRREITDVYFVDWFGPSFSHPLTIRVREDLLLMLVILTHELLHDFYLGEENNEEIEAKINSLVNEVFVKLDIDAQRQLETLQSFHDERFGKS